MGAFENFGLAVESQISGFSESVSSQLIAGLGPIAAASITIYVTARAWAILMGRENGAVGGLILSAARCALVAFFALNAGNYTAYALSAAGGLESWLLQTLPGSPRSAWAAIDALWAACAGGIESLWGLLDAYGMTHLGEEILTALCVVAMTVLGVLLTSASLGVLLLAKIALALTLGFGPAFLCCLMFPATRGWFDPWLRSTLTYVFTVVMAGAVLLFFSGLFTERIARVAAAAAGSAGPDVFGVWLELGVTLVITLTASSIIRLIPSIAAGLAGGASMQAVGLGAMLAGAFGPARAAAGAAAAGFGAGAGSASVAALGRRVLGHRGLEQPGALPMAALGAAAGGAGRLSAAAARRLSRTLRGARGGGL